MVRLLQGMTSDERLFAWLPLVNACQRQAHEEVAALVDKLATPAGS